MAKHCKRSGCNAYPVRGATVCIAHGGAIGKVRRNAAVRDEVSRWVPSDTTEDPGTVLLRLVSQSSRRAALYADLLEAQYDAAAKQETPPSMPVGVQALIGHKIMAAGKDGALFESEEAIRGLVELEGQERDRCARFAKLALDAGIAERQVRVAEAQGALLADLLRAVLSDPELGLSVEQRKAVPVVARRHLAITG